MGSKFLCFVFVIYSFIGISQEYNAYDSDGKRHGKWQKKYENSDQLRYEGTFDHGKEVGEFKFYKPESGKKPTAIKIFSKTTDTISIQYFTNTEKIISEGKMVGKERVGVWKYYHKNSDKIMMTEEYASGVLHGEQLTYFENGQLTEKIIYNNGKKQGRRVVYSEEGVLIKEFTYEQDQLHGVTKYYNMDGTLKIEGNYKRDRKNGIWNYYDNGKLTEQKLFPIKK